MWYVYILKCVDDSLYTGITNDLQRRFLAHQNKKGGRYTRAHPVELCVFFEEIATKSDALKREIEIKRLTRLQKLDLIESKK